MPDHFDIHLYLHGPLSNYGMLLHHCDTGKTVAIDCGDAGETRKALAQTGWDLAEIWVTHHHHDHTDGVAAIKAETNCLVRGPQQGRSLPIRDLDVEYWDGDQFEFAGHSIDVIATPGHTLDMINFSVPDAGLLFAGDTLFTLGCGRINDGNPAMLKQSLERLCELPGETQIFGAHEYTKTNIAFTLQVDPENEQVKERIAQLESLLAAGKPTVPVSLADEMRTNAFLRAGDNGIKVALGMQDASDDAVFAHMRALRSTF